MLLNGLLSALVVDCPSWLAKSDLVREADMVAHELTFED